MYKLYKIDVTNESGIISTYYEYAEDECEAIELAIERDTNTTLAVREVHPADKADLLAAATQRRK